MEKHGNYAVICSIWFDGLSKKIKNYIFNSFFSTRDNLTVNGKSILESFRLITSNIKIVTCEIINQILKDFLWRNCTIFSGYKEEENNTKKEKVKQ